MEKALSFEFNYSSGEVDPQKATVSKVNEDVASLGPDNKGTLAYLVEVSSTEETEGLKAKASEIARVFEETYLASEAGTILKALEEALHEAASLANENLKVEIVAAVVWGLVLYVGKIGESRVFLCRGGRSRKIEFNFVASGTIQDGDSLALVNSIFATKFSEKELDFILNQADFAVVKARFDELQKDTIGSDCLVLRIKVKETVLEEVPISFVDTDSLNTRKQVSWSDRFGKFVPYDAILKIKVLEKLTSLREFLALSSGKIFGKFAEPWRRKGPGEVVDEKSRKKARAIQVGAVLGVFLTLSLFFSVGKALEASKRNSESKILSQIEDKLAGAEAAIGINPEQVASILTDAAKLIDEAEKKGLDKKTLEEKETKLNQLLAQNKKIFPTEDFTEIVDLKAINSRADSLVVLGKNVFSLEKAAGRLIKTNSDTKKSEIQTEGLEGAFSLASKENTVYVAGKGKLWSFNSGNNSFSKILDSESAWNLPSDLSTYFGNFYLVDPAKGKIWKHFGSGSEVSRAQDYLTTPADLSRANTLAVDGYIWVGTEDGKVLKFYSGKKQDFQLSGMEVGSIKDLFTTENSTSLYLLDPKEGRVLVFDKSGNYKNAYENPAFKSSSSFFVQESSKMIWVASGTKIYRFKFK